LRKLFFIFALFPFLLFSLEKKIFPEEVFIEKNFSNCLYFTIKFKIPNKWKLYSEKKSKNGFPIKILLNSNAKNVSDIQIQFPKSIEKNGDFFYIGNQEIPIKIFLKNQSIVSLDEFDFLFVDYVMCNEESGECIKNSEKIMLKIK
jgi:hypothetical protein